MIIMKTQLQKIETEYYKLWDELDHMRTTLRKHLSTTVAAFLGVITSLHQSGENLCLEWCFFICVTLCVLSLICLLIAACENFQNTKHMMNILKDTYDEAIKTMKPINEDILVSPKLNRYTYLFWIGIISFCLAILLFCVINMPIW